MSESSDPSYSTTETLILSIRNDLGEMSKRLQEADSFCREAMMTIWELERRNRTKNLTAEAGEPTITASSDTRPGTSKETS